MSKITNALKRVDEERSNTVSLSEKSAQIFVKNTKGVRMRKTWFTWAIVTTVVVAVFFAFNYQGNRDAVPLSEIFPDEAVFPPDVEYEFVQDETVQTQENIVNAQEKIEETASVAKETQIISSKVLETPIAVLNNKKTVDYFNYTVQIASFKNQKRAKEALVKIRTKIPSAYVSSHDLGAKGVWYRIYAGQFELRSEAEVTLNNIKKSYDSSFIISPKKSK